MSLPYNFLMGTLTSTVSPLLILALLLPVLTSCGGGISGDLRSEVTGQHVAAIVVRGDRVTVTNASEVALELRRRAATGEIVGVTTLAPGERYVLEAKGRRTLELVNTSEQAARFHIRARGSLEDADDGEQFYVGMLAQRPL